MDKEKIMNLCQQIGIVAMNNKKHYPALHSDFDFINNAQMDIFREITAPQESNEMLFRKILAEVDYYYSTRKQMCYPIGYPDMLIYAVHCAVNGNHGEALYEIERVRKAREGA